MEIAGSVPRLEHEHILVGKDHRTDTPSTSTTSNQMALDSKTDLDQLSTNTLAETEISPTQSSTLQIDDTTDQPTHKTLPVELWMRVFEYVRTDDYARPAVVANYKRSLAVHGDNLEAAQTLPAFEKKTNLETVQTLLPHRPDQPRRSTQAEPMSARAPTMQSAISRPGQHATRCSTDESGSLQREQP